MRIAAVVLLLAAPVAAPAFTEVDYAKVERRIAKEPTYVGPPLYALFLFGPKGDHRVWAVLDRSRADLGYRDVLYLDKNGNGDLTEPGERFTGRYDERMARAGMAVTIRAGDLAVPGTDRVHTRLRFSTIRKTGRKGIWFTMMWCGREKVSGGAARTGIDATIWAPTAAAAPILRPTAEGPLSFAIWGGAKVPVLRIGGETRISLMVGNAGSGPDTLCYLTEKFLTPGKDRIFATVIARDAEGKRIEERSEIRGKPC